jgi:hypothetical protein
LSLSWTFFVIILITKNTLCAREITFSNSPIK